jgi:hypothetical protein
MVTGKEIEVEVHAESLERLVVHGAPGPRALTGTAGDG